MAEDDKNSGASSNEAAARQPDDNPHEGLVALEGVVYVSVSHNGIMDDDLFDILCEDEKQV